MADKIARLDVTAKPSVFRIEIKIKPIDLIDWLEVQNSVVKIYGVNQDNTAAIAGIGEALRVHAGKIDDFAYVFKQLRSYLTPQYPYMQWYGGFCFDDSHLDSHWKNFGAYRFVLPRFELARDGNKIIFCCNLIGELLESVREDILKELHCIQVNPKSSKNVFTTFSRKDLPSKEQWNHNISTVLNGIKIGNYKKIVLARKTVLKFSKRVNPFEIFRELYKVTPNSYHFYFQFEGTIFLGASPERLYRRQGRKILSEAIAGTSPRGKTARQDKVYKVRLFNSSKNNLEHQFVVTAIKNRLGPLCVKLHNKQKPQVISIGNGHHLMTPFEGDINGNVSDEDILKTLHPTPAVAGTPQDKALAVVRRLERFSRGWYAGPLGYVGLDWTEFVVGIRSALIKGKEMSVYAGAGIVQGSKSKEEWLEVENKISNFIKVIK